jgi:alkylation response protein AidB-like acyl-CoA dehydrogenase
VQFAFTDQQTEFRDAVRQVLAKECTTDHLRAAFDAPAARGPRWSVLAELGVLGLSVPEDHGGLGLGLVDLVLLLEEAGRVALPEPFLETTALAAPLMAELGGGSQVAGPATWLEGMAAGTVAAAVAEPPGARPVAGTTAGPSGARPSGAGAVAGARGADLLVLFAPGGDEGPEIHAVAAEQVTVTPVSTLDPSRRLGIPAWTPTAESRLAAGAAAHAGMRRTADRASVGTAAQLLGLSDRMITMTAEYAKARHQFGKPIGSFQAVKHLLAGAQVKLEFARPVVYAAAWSLDQGEPTASRAASTAKAYASDTALEAARVALQVHGAIGYTWECDLQLFLKRAWALAEAWGSASDHRQRVLASLAAAR